MVTLKNIKRIKDSLFNCDLYMDGEEKGYNVNLDCNNWDKSIAELPEDVWESYAGHALMLLQDYKEDDDVPTELWTMWY